MTATTITAVILLSLSLYLLIIQLIKIQKLTAILEMHIRLLGVTAVHANRAYKRMKEADRLGAFEADDDVGYAFQEIKESVTELNTFLEKYIKNDEAKEK